MAFLGSRMRIAAAGDNAVASVSLQTSSVTGSGVNSTIYNFTSVDFGTYSADRLVVCVVTGERSGVFAGIELLNIGDASGDDGYQEHTTDTVTTAVAWGRPTGTSGTVSIRFNGEQHACSLHVFVFDDVITQIPSDFSSGDSAVATTTVTGQDCQGGGVIVAAACSKTGGDTTSVFTYDGDSLTSSDRNVTTHTGTAGYLLTGATKTNKSTVHTYNTGSVEHGVVVCAFR